MKLFRPTLVQTAAAIVGLTLACCSPAAETPSPLTASELASRLSAFRQNGESYVRLRMEVKGATKQTFQLQIKERRTNNSSEVVYQVLYPKERKGESILLQKMGNGRAIGSHFVPPDTLRPIDDLKKPLLGSDLAYEDVVDNFFGWDQQTLVGNAEEDGVKCSILESKPGKDQDSIYGSVRSWLDVRRMVPLRIEKYDRSGLLLRRIDTRSIVTDAGHQIPSILVVRGAGGNSSTLLDGSRIRHDVTYTDDDFTPDGLKIMATPEKP